MRHQLMTVPVEPVDLRNSGIVGSHLDPLTHGRTVEMAAIEPLDLRQLINRAGG